jgi:hypothetical protein
MTAATLRDLGALTAAEQQILAEIGSGAFSQIGDGRLPAEGDEGRTVRAAFLRLLLTEGEGAPRLHEKGLELRGAWIAGVLDLEGCRVPHRIALADCRFEEALVVQGASIGSLLLDGSIMPGFRARALVASGSLHLRAARIEGTVDLLAARLDGEFVLEGGTVTPPGDMAFNAAYIATRGDLILRGTVFRGVVKVSGAKLGGDLAVDSATIEHPGKTALAADGIRVGGDVTLRFARLLGEASFIGARVSGDVRLEGGTFEAPDALAIVLNRAHVEGALFLRAEARVKGGLSLTGATIGSIADEAASWPEPGDLLMNRFRYGGFIGGPVDARSRLDWLARQSPKRWGDDFWPQPYEHLATVLNQMGHQEEARTILYEKERLQRRARRDRARSPLTRAARAAEDTLLWLTIGYGLQPLLAFVWLAVFWLIGVGLLAAVEAQGQLRPNLGVFLRSPEWVLCAATPERQVPMVSLGERPGLARPGQTQLDCFLAQPEAGSYPKFNAWMYAFETLIPGLDAGQRSAWSPDTRKPLGLASKLFEYVQMVAGFGLGLLAFAGFSGLVKSK